MPHNKEHEMGVLERFFKQGISNQVRPTTYNLPGVLGYNKGYAKSLLGFLKGGLTDEYQRNPHHSIDFFYNAKDPTGASHSNKDAMKARIDLFRIGLGLPQKFGTMVQSEYRPTKGNVGNDEVFWDFKKGLNVKDRGTVLGKYKQSSPSDSSYTSYYDIWDIDLPHKTWNVEGSKPSTKLEKIKGIGAQSLIDMLYSPPKIYGRDYKK
jgi:hypothetical protein